MSVARGFGPTATLLTNGKMLILEVKGQDDQQQTTKREFLSEWVRAINTNGGFGQWCADVSRHPKDVLEILERHNSPTPTTVLA